MKAITHQALCTTMIAISMTEYLERTEWSQMMAVLMRCQDRENDVLSPMWQRIWDIQREMGIDDGDVDAALKVMYDDFCFAHYKIQQQRGWALLPTCFYFGENRPDDDFVQSLARLYECHTTEQQIRV